MTDWIVPEGVSIAHPDKLYIDGEWASPSTDSAIEIISPDTEEIVARVAEAREADMDAAVAAARHAFDTSDWPHLPPADRASWLKRLADALRPREAELSRAWTAQVGGLASFAPILTGNGTLNIDAMVELADSFEFEKAVETEAGAIAMIRREPAGVVAAIAPWNAPYGIMTGKIAPALLAGCTVVMKPSPETPLEAYIIAEAADAIGLPAGVLNLVCGDREASDHLVHNPGVDKVAFTGSTLAGKRIASVCGERIARCTLELGGKSAAIVLDDFPTEAAAQLLANTITIMSGQVCAMLSRAIVPKQRHDELAEAIAGEMAKIRIGHSGDPETQLGPLAMERQLHRVEGYVEQGKATADLVCGGARPTSMNRGYFIEPTLFANVDNSSAIAQEEIFGPVLSLIPCEDGEDAIRIANDSHYGLSGSVLTTDAEEAWRIAKRMRTGGVGQNGLRMDFKLPFGGYKQSGLGREGGAEGLGGYLETKTVILDGVPEGFA
jgi:acyl-CoA reductase-like NAD-dependent aldehyde dehydrogenase